MGKTMFPHHDWADADGLDEPDPELARTGYFHHDPDGYSDRLRGWHQVLWSKETRDARLALRPEGGGLRDEAHGLYLSSDAAVPVWERWGEVQGFLAATEERLKDAGRGSIHDLGWRLYDMGGMVLFPGLQVDGRWTINQAKGCTRTRIADRLDLTLECIRLYYEALPACPAAGALPMDYDGVNPLGSVLHRYRSFFELFGSFQGYVEFWLLDDLVITDQAGSRVKFWLPRPSTGPYDFGQERALPTNDDQYFEYLVAADDFVTARNHRMARVAHDLGCEVCPACLAGADDGHRRWSLDR